jgi:predicted XRE-type DNA-binding protein
MKDTQTYSDVWDAVAETSSEAANLKIRSRLMIALADYVERQNITQAEAARRFGVPRSRVSELVNGKISKFSIDRLVNMAASVDLETHIAVRQRSQQSNARGEAVHAASVGAGTR